MNTLKEKLLSSYFKEDFLSEDYFHETERLSPLRRFIYTLGLDYKDLNKKQLYKWSRTKRYRNFKKMRKIKRIADEANLDDSFIYDNIEVLLKEFKLDDDDTLITADEVISILPILEGYKISQLKGRSYGATKAHQFGARGKYRTKQQRSTEMRHRILKTINSGGIVSSGEGGILFKGTGKKAKKPLGTGKMLFLTRVPSKKGGMKYHRKIYKVY